MPIWGFGGGSGGGGGSVSYSEYDAGNSGASKTIDFANGLSQRVTLTASCTLTLSGASAGDTGFLQVHQDMIGSRLVTWANALFPSGVAPTLATSPYLINSFLWYFNGTDYELNHRGQYTDSDHPFNPSSISGNILWLDANDTTTITKDGSNKVSQWADKSPSALVYAQATGSNQPTWVAGLQNGKPGVRFDGVNDYLQGTSTALLAGTSPASIWIVFKTVSAGAFTSIMNFYATTASHSTNLTMVNATQLEFGAAASNLNPGMKVVYAHTAYHLLAFNFTGAGNTTSDWEAWVNASSVADAAASAGSGDNLNLLGTASTGGGFASCEILELAVYNAQLSGANKTNLEAYFQTKYGTW
jgi:hypothetical protein